MFNDQFASAHFETLVKRHGIRSVVETGTYHGESALRFAKLVDYVVTIEVNEEYYAQHAPALWDHGIRTILGSSPDAISTLRDLPQRCCFYLDAHWYQYWPILDELRAIAGLIGGGFMKTPVILIHDFKVPGHPELGYDSYGGMDLDWDYVKKDALAICPHYRWSYNDRADGYCRGILRLEPPDDEP